MSSLATSYDTVRRRGKMETHELTEGSTENAKCPKNVEKVSRYKGSVLVHWVPGAGAGASTKIKYEIIEKVNKI